MRLAHFYRVQFIWVPENDDKNARIATQIFFIVVFFPVLKNMSKQQQIRA